VSRVIATLKAGLEAWRTHSLTDLDVIYVYLDGFALRVRSAGKVVSVPVLGVIGVLPDGRKHLLALELCAGESFAAWKGCLEDLVARGLRVPVLAIIDGSAGRRRAVGEIWPGRPCNAVVSTNSAISSARRPSTYWPRSATTFTASSTRRMLTRLRPRTRPLSARGPKRCPGVITSLREGGDELLTFFIFPKAQWKTLRTTNTIERLHEEFRRRVKTQWSLPSEDSAVVLLFSLVASGQIRLRSIDGWRKIASVLSQHTAVAA